MTETLGFVLVSFFLSFKILRNSLSPSFPKPFSIVFQTHEYNLMEEAILRAFVLFHLKTVCGLVPGLVWLGQNWNCLNVCASSGNGVHGGFGKGWLCGLGTYIPITFWHHSLAPPFLKDTSVSCFCCSFCARGSALVHSDGDVKEFLSVRFQLSCAFLRELECSSKVLLLSVFVSFIHLLTCLLCIFHQTEVSGAHEIGSL